MAEQLDFMQKKTEYFIIIIILNASLFSCFSLQTIILKYCCLLAYYILSAMKQYFLQILQGRHMNNDII